MFMKILMLLFTRRNEGTFYRAFPWAVFLASRGHVVTILCTSAKHRFRKTVSMDHGVRIIETPALFDGRRIMARLSGMHGWGPLDIATRCKEIRTGHYDIVHTFEHHMHVSLPVYLAGRKRVPVLVSDWCDHYGRDGLPGDEYSPYRLRRLYNPIGLPFRIWTEYLEGALRRRADAVTVISSYLRERALSQGVPKEKIHLIRGSAEIELVQPQPACEARKKLGLDENLHYSLFFGASQFDLYLSLEAFAQVAQKRPDARVVVLGRKDCGVAHKAAELGIDGQIIQTGWVADDQLSDWLACADVCLLPMKNHPVNEARWPNKIGFYMAAGRPTVATGIGDAGRLIAEHGIGMTSRVNPHDFAEKILYLFEHSEAAAEMGRRARALAEEEFAPSMQGADVERLYLNLLKEAHD
jgi:glycosyltransferase involved in cell wall biosynthesis